MCAYKLCKVEFRYWGMQTKIEKFIHDVGMYCIVKLCTPIVLHYYFDMLCYFSVNCYLNGFILMDIHKICYWIGFVFIPL